MTPVFNRQRRGYNIEEVDQYVKLLRGEYEKISARCKMLDGHIKQYEVTQSELVDTLYTARIMAKHIKNEAEDKASIVLESAEGILHEANAKALRIIADTQASTEHIIAVAKEEAAEIKKRSESIRDEIRGICEHFTTLMEEERRNREAADEQEAAKAAKAHAAHAQRVRVATPPRPQRRRRVEKGG